MELFASPAVMGTLVMSVAMAGWLLGRWQGVHASGQAITRSLTAMEGSPSTSSAPKHNGAAGDAGVPCQATAQADRGGARLDATDSLGALHAEVSAYRRAERVLAGMDQEQLQQLQPFETATRERRSNDRAGPPTGTLVEARQAQDRQAQGERGNQDSADRPSKPVQAATQPSSASPDGRRV